eukprot:6198024-Pleurochrysis_carterae.AAC.1
MRANELFSKPAERVVKRPCEAHAGVMRTARGLREKCRRPAQPKQLQETAADATVRISQANGVENIPVENIPATTR